jgi:hypothetical protein
MLFIFMGSEIPYGVCLSDGGARVPELENVSGILGQAFPA